ncbi:MAG: hypothetical protein E5W38_16265 [Mesorhizobium sp.]|nr:MAG: hypothetical protein E5W38_16265 [Mesorhizobium sp.]TKB19079.1 MAG: hypothetical protein E5V75_07930 [Mesorhizobium sp.]
MSRRIRRSRYRNLRQCQSCLLCYPHPGRQQIPFHRYGCQRFRCCCGCRRHRARRRHRHHCRRRDRRRCRHHRPRIRRGQRPERA